MGALRASSSSRVAWARISIAVVVVVFAFEATVRSATPVGDQDSFWIAAAGRVIWATGHAPVTNAFSFTDPTHAWVFHELAFGVLYAKGLAWLGPAFFDVFGVLAGALTVAIAVFHVARTTQRRLTVALVSLPLLVEIPLFHPRPPFASLALVAAMTALAFSASFTLRHAVLAVLLEWLWTLAHGSFPLGVVLLLLAAAEPGSGLPRSRRRLLATAGSALAVTLLNPYGLRLHGLVGRYLVGDHDATSVIHGHVVEFLPIWSAPFAFGPFDAPAVALVLAASLLCLAHPHLRLRALFVLAFGVFAAFEVRNVHLALLLSAMLLAPEIDRRLPSEDASPTLSPAKTACVAVVPGVLVAITVWAFLLVSRSTASWLGANVGGPDLLVSLTRIPDDAHVYAPFGISPAVIWYGGPRGLRVFYDSRNDCYSPAIALTSFTLEDPGSTPAATLSSYGVEYALVRRGGPVAAALASSDTWTLFADAAKTLVVFRRASR